MMFNEPIKYLTFIHLLLPLKKIKARQQVKSRNPGVECLSDLSTIFNTYMGGNFYHTETTNSYLLQKIPNPPPPL